MTSNHSSLSIRLAASILLAGFMGGHTSPAYAGDECLSPGGACCNIDYSKLNLDKTQTARLQQYDQDWFQEYQKVQPEIQGLQQRFKGLLASPEVDSTEVMRVQQQIDQKRSALKSKATQILIQKRRVLQPNQNRLLDGMIKEEITKRKVRTQGENVVPVRWQKILNNVTNIFPQNQE
ncbi:MAG: hypothetical protein K2Z81_27605 [Cyanobacteria bacterium]|nr:hypothetical protein [Cyanobacteriota bacterium]